MDSEEDKKLLVEQSGRITLVLCVMASTIKFQRRYKSYYSLKDYLKEMKDQQIQYSDESNALDLTYEKSMQKIVRFAVSKLIAIGGPMGRIGVKIFDRLACCSPTNWLTEGFFERYFRDICEEAKNVDMKLPLKPAKDLEFIRMAIEKLSEFSLVQINGHEFTIHRLIQALRRLDLKDSGEEKIVLRKLLVIAPYMSDDYQNTSIIWHHVTDYSDLIKEFYREKRTLMQFPIINVDLLEKIIPELTQTTDFEPLENYSEEIEQIIYKQIDRCTLDAVQRTLKVFNYDASKNSEELLFTAISITNLDAVKWLVNDMSCIPEEEHLRCCMYSSEIIRMQHYMTKLKMFYTDTIKGNLGKNPFERAFNKFKSFRRSSISRSIASLEITYLLSTLADLDPLKIILRRVIEKNCGKKLFKRILSCKPKIVKSDTMRFISDCIKMFRIIKVLLSTSKNLESINGLNEIREKHSETNLLECLFICGRTHYSSDKPFLVRDYDWSHLHVAAYENNFPAIESIDSTLIESKDKLERTPIMIAVGVGACEATSVLLEKYSANVNALDIFGDTPLSRSIQHSHPSILKILLRHGAKTHWTIKSGESIHALHKALECFSSHDIPELEEIIGTLLTSKDCDICATDRDGNNILHQLVRDYYGTKYKPNHRVLHLILSANSTLVNVTNNDGITPLQSAKKLQSKFSGEHWHFSSLESVILELQKFCEKNV